MIVKISGRLITVENIKLQFNAGFTKFVNIAMQPSLEQ